MLLARYILRTHAAPFLFGTVVIMVLFLLQYIMRWVDQLASKGLDIATIVMFLVLNLSWIVVLAVPVGVLFSTIMAFGAMSTTHEVTVMKASGVGLLRMMMPVVLTGCLLWGFVFWYTDTVLPETNVRLSAMMRDIERTKPTFAVDEGQFSTYLDGVTVLARHVDTNGRMRGLTIYDRSRSESRNVISADSGRLMFSPSLTRLVVQLYNGEIHQRAQRDPNEYRVIKFAGYQMTLPAENMMYQASDVTGTSRSDREMSIADMRLVVDRAELQMSEAQKRFDTTLRQHLDYLLKDDASADTSGRTWKERIERATSILVSTRSTLESECFRRSSELSVANKYLVEIHKKYAIPFACLLFVFVGCPMGILTKGGSFGSSALLSLGFYVLYWISMIGGEKLADRGLLSPAVAMWVGNAAISLIAAVVTLRVNSR
ncbi:MAG: LptF/LptG family permease [Bacteroidota bacterium]|jgi:lipopolysaccharide export system permease protein